MRDPGKVLGIRRDATLAEIKRAYARKLKQNRPDDDPVAFARVQQAFEACVARFKRREAELEDQDNVEDDWLAAEDGSDAGGVLADQEDASLADDAGRILEEEALAAEEDDAPGHGARKLANAILDVAGTRSPEALASWLRAEDRLYDIGFKHAVGDAVIERATRDAESLGWRKLAEIFEFFEVDSISDRRLRNDFFARQAWVEVQGDIRFDRGIRARRGPHLDFADRMVQAELFDPPDRWRHVQMHLIPTLAGQLRNRFNELLAEDPERAEAVISTQARDYWLPVTDRARLHWRRVAIVVVQLALLAAPLAVVLALPDLAAARLFRTFGAVLGVMFGIWLALAVLALGQARYSAWRLRTVGAGEAPAGANPLADRPTAIALVCAVVSLCLVAVALRMQKGGGLMIPQVWLVMFMAIATYRSTRIRWEAIASSLAVATFVYPILGLLRAPGVETDLYTLGPGALSVGILAVLLLDGVHARATRQAFADLRDAVSLPQCAMAVLASVGVWLR